MTHFFRCSVPLSPVILFIVFLLPFCQAKNISKYPQLDTTMADQFTCPSGSQWYVLPSKQQIRCHFIQSSPSNFHRYACPNSGTSSKFVGCCAGGDPCSKGCAEGNIRAAGFNASHYGEFPDASCGVNSKFYTCLGPGNATTFWGCCKTAACATTGLTCDGNLAAAFLDQPAQYTFYLGASTGDPSTTSSATAGSKSNGAVIGGAVGGAIGGLLVIGLIVFFIFRRRRSQKQASRGIETAEVVNPYTDGGKTFDPNSPNLAAQSRKYL